MKEDIAKAKKIDFYGEIEQYFLKYIYIFQTHSLLQNCSKDCIYNGNMIISDNSAIIGFGKLRQKNIAIVSSEISKCSLCSSRVTCDINFKYNTLFVFMEPRSHFKINELPEHFLIDGKKYILLCAIVHLKKQKHFVGIFTIGSRKYLVDDLTPTEFKCLDKDSNNNQQYLTTNLSNVLYYLSA